MKTLVLTGAWLAATIASTSILMMTKPVTPTFWVAAGILGSCVLTLVWQILGDSDNTKAVLSRSKIGPATPQDVAEMRRVYFHS